MAQKKVFIVCGYGCDLSLKYQRYLRRVVGFIITENPYAIIVCGGFSQLKSAPNTSEASVIESFLRDRMTAIPGISILQEDKSLTTSENLINAQKIMDKLDIRSGEIVIFCDASRALKVKIIARRVLKGYSVRVEAYDLSSLDEAPKQLLATIKDALAVYLPVLDYLQRKQRERRALKI